MTSETDDTVDTVDSPLPLGPFPYAVAALSIFPGLGILFGLIAVLWGLATLARGGKVVAIVGALGICSQILVFSALFHFLFR